MDHATNAARVFNKLADIYQVKFMDVSPYAHLLDGFIDALPKTDSAILEIACGPGNITKYLLAKNGRLKILGIDLAPRMIELARENCPQATFEVRDCRTISELSDVYNGIVCAFCTPYLSKEEVILLIKDAAKLLKEEGILYLSTIEGVYENSGFRKSSTGDEVYQYFYSYADMQVVFDQSNLMILSHEKINAGYNADTDLIFLAKKNSSPSFSFRRKHTLTP